MFQSKTTQKECQELRICYYIISRLSLDVGENATQFHGYHWMSGRMLFNFTVIIGCRGGMLYNFTVIVGCRGECYTISRLSLDVGGNDIQFHGYCSMSGGMLYLGLFFLNTVHCEASLDIIQKTEVLIRPLDGNNI